MFASRPRQWTLGILSPFDGEVGSNYHRAVDEIFLRWFNFHIGID